MWKILGLRKDKCSNPDGPRTEKSGPGGIRTPDHGIKSPALYLAKLLAHGSNLNFQILWGKALFKGLSGAGRIRTCDRPVSQSPILGVMHLFQRGFYEPGALTWLSYGPSKGHIPYTILKFSLCSVNR